MGYTYIRIADGGDKNPNNRNVRWSPGGGASGECSNCLPPGQTIKIDNKSYNTIKDFSIRGGRYGVYIFRSTAHDNIIEDCYITSGTIRVGVASGAYNNVIRNNKMVAAILGFDKYTYGPYETYDNYTYNYTGDWDY